MTSHLYYHVSLALLWTMEIGPAFLSCQIAVCSPRCGKRHLFNPVRSRHALLHTSNGCQFWSEKKNPLTLVLPPAASVPFLLLACSSPRHSWLRPSPPSGLSLNVPLRLIFLLTWNGSPYHFLVHYPVTFSLVCVPLTYIWFLKIYLSYIFLHKNTAPWKPNFVHYFPGTENSGWLIPNAQ